MSGVRVVGAQAVGAASDVEVAAVVAVLGLAGGGSAPEPAPTASQWASPRRAVRSVLDGGAPGSWRASALPR